MNFAIAMNYPYLAEIHNEFVNYKATIDRETGIDNYLTLCAHNAYGERFLIAQFLTLDHVFDYINREHDFLTDFNEVLVRHGAPEPERDEYVGDIADFIAVSRGINGRGGLQQIKNAFHTLEERYENLCLVAYYERLALEIVYMPYRFTIKFYPVHPTRGPAVIAMDMITDGYWPPIGGAGAGGAGAGAGGAKTGGKRKRKTGKKCRRKSGRKRTIKH